MGMRFRPLVVGLILVAVAAALLQAGEGEASHTFLRFPWTFGKQGYITQGYNGSSHQNQDYYALDVDVEFGAVLNASRPRPHVATP